MSGLGRKKLPKITSQAAKVQQLILPDKSVKHVYYVLLVTKIIQNDLLEIMLIDGLMFIHCYAY